MEPGVIDVILRGQGLLVFLLGLLFAVAGWMLRAHILQIVAAQTAGKASADMVSEIDRRLDAHEGRLTSIETALRHLPTADQVQALRELFADLRGEVRAIRATVEGMDKMMVATGRRVELIDEHLKRGA